MYAKGEQYDIRVQLESAEDVSVDRADSPVSTITSKIRKDFPETWMWDSFAIDGFGLFFFDIPILRTFKLTLHALSIYCMLTIRIL